MQSADSTFEPMMELFANFAGTGRIVAICVRPQRMADVIFKDVVKAVAATGLEGDRHRTKNGARQATLIQQEHLEAIASFMHIPSVDPALTRRNIVVRGINLLSLKGKRFRIGEALFEYSGECHPCSRMEENLGVGGYNAMRGHGGITARIIESGTIRVNDEVIPLE